MKHQLRSVTTTHMERTTGAREASLSVGWHVRTGQHKVLNPTQIFLRMNVCQVKIHWHFHEFNSFKFIDTGLLHHFHFNLRRLYEWDILRILIFTRVSTDWHVSLVFMVHTESFIFVSVVLTLYAHWLVPTSKVITLYIWLPKTEFMPICFCLNFFICGCE